MRLLLFCCFLNLSSFFSIAQDKTIIYDANVEVRHLPSFNQISVSGGIDLYISPDDRQVVAVSGKGVLTEVVGSELRISADQKMWGVKGKVYVSIPTAERIVSSGSSNVYIKGLLKAKNLLIDLSGASDFFGAVYVDNLIVHQSGSSDVTLKGEVNQLESHLSGASDLKAFSCKVEYLTVHASGACDVEVNVNKEIKASMSGASDIKYKGNAVIKQKAISGASTLKSIDSQRK